MMQMLTVWGRLHALGAVVATHPPATKLLMIVSSSSPRESIYLYEVAAAAAAISPLSLFSPFHLSPVAAVKWEWDKQRENEKKKPLSAYTLAADWPN